MLCKKIVAAGLAQANVPFGDVDGFAAGALAVDECSQGAQKGACACHCGGAAVVVVVCRIKVELVCTDCVDKIFGGVAADGAGGEDAAGKAGASDAHGFSCGRGGLPYAGDGFGVEGVKVCCASAPEAAVGFVVDFHVDGVDGNSGGGLECANHVFVDVGGYFGPGDGVVGVVGAVVAFAQAQINAGACAGDFPKRGIDFAEVVVVGVVEVGIGRGLGCPGECRYAAGSTEFAAGHVLGWCHGGVLLDGGGVDGAQVDTCVVQSHLRNPEGLVEQGGIDLGAAHSADTEGGLLVDAKEVFDGAAGSAEIELYAECAALGESAGGSTSGCNGHERCIAPDGLEGALHGACSFIA